MWRSGKLLLQPVTCNIRQAVRRPVAAGPKAAGAAYRWSKNRRCRRPVPAGNGAGKPRRRPRFFPSKFAIDFSAVAIERQHRLQRFDRLARIAALEEAPAGDRRRSTQCPTPAACRRPKGNFSPGSTLRMGATSLCASTRSGAIDHRSPQSRHSSTTAVRSAHRENPAARRDGRHWRSRCRSRPN